MLQIINMSYLVEANSSIHHEAERMGQQLLKEDYVSKEEGTLLENQGKLQKLTNSSLFIKQSFL